MARLTTFMCITAFLALTSNSARADLIIDFSQDGPDLVVSASGSIDLTGLTLLTSDLGANQQLLFADASAESVRRVSSLTDVYNFDDGGVDLFTGIVPFALADSFTGDDLGFQNTFDGDFFIYLPNGYTTGDSISGTVTFEDFDLATLGVTEQIVSWGGGADQAVQFTVGGGMTAVPEPTTMAIWSVFGAAGFWGVRRRKKNV